MSFESDERQIRASLGLHRGRRALGLALLAVTGIAGLLLLVGRDEPPVLVSTQDPEPPGSPAVPSLATRAPVKRRSWEAHVKAPVRLAARVAPPAERGAPPSAEVSADRVAPPERSAPSAPPSVERSSDRVAQVSELVAPTPAAQPAAAELDVVAASDAPPAQPLPEPAEPSGSDGSAEAIARAIAAAKRAAVRNCFEHELKQQPKLTGTVVVELDLAAPDRVEALRVTDDLNRPDFTRCVTSAMQGLRFAALDEDVSVRVPYSLSPVPR